MGSALESDIEFGKKLIQEGRATAEQVQECLDLLNELARRGAAAMPSLRALLLQRGYLRPDPGENTANVERSTPRPRDSQRLPVPDGERVGKYIKVKKLGEGGMGEVWMAWDTKLERWVALKFIKSRDAEELVRFQREAQTAAKLSHPNIAAVYEAHLHYIAMQFIEGQTLHTFPRDNVRLLVDIMRQAALAVHFAHQQGIIHRDLKPPNIMVSKVSTTTTTHAFAPGSRESVQVFVMDFGLAKTMSVDSSISASGTVIGTPMYMSPEQAQANRAVDARADVYSLGATLYELLTDTAPFTSPNVYDLLRKIVSEDPLPVRRVNPQVDPELETIAMRCLEKDPGRRYQTAMEFSEELTRWLEGEPILAHPPSGFYRLRKRVAKNPWAWTMAGIAAALVLFGAALVGLISSEADTSRQVADLVQKIERLVDQRDYDRAFSLAEEATAKNPNDPTARYWMARLLIRKYQESRGVPEARVVRGTIELVPPRPETQKERHWREEAVKAVPDSGILRLWNEEYDEAEAAFARVRPDDPGAWEAEFYRGVIRYFKGEFAEARRLIQPHKNRDPFVTLPAWVRTLAALAQETEQRGEDADELYTQAESAAIEIEGDRGRLLRAQILIARGRSEAGRGRDAEERFAKAIELLKGLEEPEAHATLGDAHFARAEYGRQRGQADPPYALALEAYGKAGYASAHARCAEAWVARYAFEQQFGKGDPEHLAIAAEEYQKALKLRSDYVDASIGLARVLRAKTHKFDDEIRTLKELAQRRPDHLPIYRALAESYRALAVTRQLRGEEAVGDFHESIRHYSTLVERNPKDGEALLERSEARLGVALYVFERMHELSLDFQIAIDDATRAIEVNPRNSNAHMARGWARQILASARRAKKEDAREHYEAALADLGRALELNPRNVLAHRCRGVAYQNFGVNEMERGRSDRTLFDKAFEDFSTAVELNTLDGESYRMRGRAHENLAALLSRRKEPHEPELERAAADYSQAIRINPADAAAYLRRAVTYGSLRRFAEAEKDFDRCGRLDPQLKPHAESLRRNLRR